MSLQHGILKDNHLIAQLSVTEKRICSLMEFIDQNIQNPELCPRLVAEKNRISIRYLHYLLASKNMKFVEYIQQQRLNKAAEWLRDEAM